MVVLGAVVALASAASAIFLSGYASLAAFLMPVVAWMAIGWDALKRTKRGPSPMHPLHRWGAAAAVAVLLWFGLFPFIRGNVARTLVITSRSMEPTLLEGDRVVVTPYDRRSVRHRDIVVFRWPDDSASLFISRVVATSGDTIAMDEWELSLNGVPVDEPEALVSDSAGELHPWMSWQTQYLLDHIDSDAYAATSETWGPLVVPENAFFMLGDHRDLSLDSRYRGFVPRDHVMGRVRRVSWSQGVARGELRWDRVGRAPQ
jgi:signal peptidase I